MQYMGGKSRISKYISEVLNNALYGWEIKNQFGYCKDNLHTHTHTHTHTQVPFVSLFCGTCSVESKVNAEIKILNDKHEYLIELLKAVQNGYDIPEEITEGQYKYIRENKDKDKALTGFVGFGCSFGGKWFGGYARNRTGTNYALQSKKSLMKDMSNLMDAQFFCMDYKDVPVPDGSVVYADPPYSNTTGYGTKLKFDSGEFWEYMRKISKTNTVFISEETAPDDFECVWSKEFTRTLDVNKGNQPKKVEKLFQYKG